MKASVGLTLKNFAIYLPDKPAIPTVYGWVRVRAIPMPQGPKETTLS
jgi:hypothetical protein